MPETAPESPILAGDRPARQTLEHLTSLWFQITGFLCNLECTHCLVDSSPRNKSMAFLERETIRRYLREAEDLGVKEIYFTGGEPFLHEELPGILEDALAYAPTTVLTNGTLVTERIAYALGELEHRSRYSLEIRVSMDHVDLRENDRVRGAGTHAKALRAVLRLQEAGLLPIVTVTEYVQGRASPQGPSTPQGPSIYEAFRNMLVSAGVRRPRLKILPVFHTGKLEDPSTGGPVTEAMMAGIDPLLLQCAETRVVTARGIYACPILVGKAVAFLGAGALSEAKPDVVLAHHACRTCYETGMSCGNS